MVNNNHFKDKTVWITGAGSGFGLALAEALLSQGANVIASVRQADQLASLVNEYASSIKILYFELTEFDTYPEKIAQAWNAFGKLDIVIFNAAIAQSSLVVDTPLNKAMHIMHVDYFSHTELARQLIPYFTQQGQGHFVAISGLLAIVPLPKRSTYSAAKAALHSFFNCLRMEVVADNIDVTVLVPGAMKTTFASKVTNNRQPKISQGVELSYVVEQALEAINQRVYETYIGVDDKSYHLYRLLQRDPNEGINQLISMSLMNK